MNWILYNIVKKLEIREKLELICLSSKIILNERQSLMQSQQSLFLNKPEQFLKPFVSINLGQKSIPSLIMLITGIFLANPANNVGKVRSLCTIIAFGLNFLISL